MLFFLSRTLVGEFYRRNAGLLLAAALVGGAIMSGTEHKALINAALRSRLVLAVAYGVPWAVWTALTLRFASRLWAEPPYEALRVLRLVPRGRRWLLGLAVAGQLLAPLWLYAAWMALIGLPQGFGGAVGLIGGYLSLLSVLSWLGHEWALRHPPGAGWAPLAFLDRLRPPAALWFLREKLRGAPLGWFALKGVSQALIWGMTTLYDPAGYDRRLLTLGALLVAVLHARLVTDLHTWERTRLGLLWNLPRTRGRYLLDHGLLLAATLLPETIGWARRWPTALGSGLVGAATQLAFSVSLLLLFRAALLWRPRPADRVLQRALLGGFAVYFLVMARVPVLALAGGALAGAAALVHSWLWRTEETMPL